MKTSLSYSLIASALALGFVAGYGFRGSSSQPAPPAADSRPKLTIPANQAVVGYLDQVNGQPVISVLDGGEVQISGWAGCASASALDKVEVLVDGQPRATAVMSLPRPDVAEAYGRPDFARSGWKASFPAQGIKAGPHPITARAACADGGSGVLTPFQLIVKAP